jgi:methylated-DNA-[protein]-cysteine S-methyltransferase
MFFFGILKNVCIFFLMISTYTSILESTYGRLIIYSSDIGITKIEFSEEPIEEKENNHSFQCRSELLDYFDGRLQNFGVSLDISQHTAFHQQVWTELQKIPYGKTCSYMDIATRLNNKKAIRAVGRANGANPIPFIIPCHRVIGSDGSLTGYAWGLDKKRRLLSLENPEVYPMQTSLF